VSLVIDSSITLAWYFEDEQTEASTAVLHSVADTGAMVPALWRLEVANGLQMAVRRRRITADYRDASLNDLRSLAIEIDRETEVHAWSATLGLAERHGLTLYDAAYLELAVRFRRPLATFDRELIKAAHADKVELVGVGAP
jgi:predicted nucleic acid-binding protein